MLELLNYSPESAIILCAVVAVVGTLLFIAAVELPSRER